MTLIKRFFDISLVLIFIPILVLPAIIIALVIIITSERPTIYWSDRVGRGNSIFRMPKFRTMKKETPQAATHLLRDAEVFTFQWENSLEKPV